MQVGTENAAPVQSRRGEYIRRRNTRMAIFSELIDDLLFAE